MTKQRKKNISLIIGLVILGFLSWKFSVVKTFNLKRDIEAMKLNISELPEENELLKIQEEQKWLDSIISDNNYSNIEIQNAILYSIEEVNTNTDLKLISFSEPYIYNTKDGTKAISFHFEIQGNYQNLEKVSYNLEKSGVGQITSLEIIKNKNYKNGKEYLQASYLLTYNKAEMH